MSISLFIRKSILLFVLFPAITFAETSKPKSDPTMKERGDALLAKHNKAIDLIQADINKTSKEVYDKFMSEPMGVVESGCLDQLRLINTNILIVDPYDILAGVYESLKQQLYDMACEAANAKMAEIDSAMDEHLKIPILPFVMSYGPETVSEDSTSAGFDIDLSSQAAADITNGILGGVRVSKYDARKDIIKINPSAINPVVQPFSSKEIADKVSNFLSVDSLWGGDEPNENKGDDNE